MLSRTFRSLFHRYWLSLVVVMAVAISFGAGLLLSYFADLEDETVPLFDISTTLSTSLSSIILLAWTVSVSILIIVAVVVYSLRKAVAGWNPLLPPTVALLHAVVHSSWIRKLYAIFSVVFVAFIGTFGDFRLLAFGTLLLWEMLFTVHLLFYHLQDPNYGVLSVYALYLPFRLRQLKTVVVFSSMTFILVELIKLALPGAGA
jgi:hypothetical protein